MGIIKLKNMQFYGYHGVYDHEKKLGAPFEVDVEITKPFKEAASSDDISHTVNYDSIFNLVDNTVSNSKYNLIETLADKIANKILNNYEIDKVVVRVRKPKVQINGILDTVEVETEKIKSE
tara:strand:+ start:9654 stop:10016 length:363 start_codon:yes stop_codon:yes gene_type:complete